ncbi:PASTA domain-containing protein [Streptomyces sp. NPDC054841]
MAALTFGNDAGPDGGVGVPDVVGKTRAEAEKKLRDFGLTPQVREIVAEGKAGDVFSHEPPVGGVRPKGSVVTLHVITTPPTPKPLPDLAKKLDELTKAVAKLEAETSAKARYDALVKKLDQIAGKVSGKTP